MWTSMISLFSWFWNWLLQLQEDIPRNLYIAVILAMVIALLFYIFIFEVFLREEITIERWRAVLYRRISNGVDRLHHDIIVLREQMELDEICGVCYYKPNLKEQYKEKLNLLKQELICLEKTCFQYPRQNTQKNHISQSEDKAQDIKLTERTRRREIMIEDEMHPRYRWNKECARDFHQWIQSSEFYESELNEGVFPLYHYRKGVKSSKLTRDQYLEDIEFKGSFAYPYPESLMYIGYRMKLPI